MVAIQRAEVHRKFREMYELPKKSTAAVVAILSIAILADWFFQPQNSAVRLKASRLLRHQLPHKSSPKEIYNYAFGLFKELPYYAQAGILKDFSAESVEFCMVEKLQNRRDADFLNRTLTEMFVRVPRAVYHFHDLVMVIIWKFIEESPIDDKVGDLPPPYESYGGLLTLVAIVSLLTIPPCYGLKNSFFKVKTFDLRGGQGTQDGTGATTSPEASLDVE